MSTYTLNVINESGETGSACLYLSPVDLAQWDPSPLAWFAEPSTPTPLVWGWSLDYSFVAGVAAPLAGPASVFVPAAMEPTDLSTNNDIPLTYAEGALVFGPATPGTQAGSMTIDIAADVPPNLYSAGVGIDGRAAAITQADPGSSLVFVPNPLTYWITFGAYLPGQVLDLRQIHTAGEIVFPSGVTSLTATYSRGGLWLLSDDQPGNGGSPKKTRVVSRKPPTARTTPRRKA